MIPFLLDSGGISKRRFIYISISNCYSISPRQWRSENKSVKAWFDSFILVAATSFAHSSSPCLPENWTPDLIKVVGYKMVLSNDIDLLHPPAELEKRKHKLKRLVQSPNSFFMDVKCQGCFNITTVFSHSQTVVVCGSCQTVLCQPTGGKARLTEGCSFRKKGDWLFYSFTKGYLWWVFVNVVFNLQGARLFESREWRIRSFASLLCWLGCHFRLLVTSNIWIFVL